MRFPRINLGVLAGFLIVTGVALATDGYQIKEKATTIVGGWFGPAATDYDALHLDPTTKELLVKATLSGSSTTPVAGTTSDAASLAGLKPVLHGVSDGTTLRSAAGTNKGEVAVVMTSTTIAAGTAIVGKVGIDQTTPGTTNGVQVNAALPAGSAIIGKVSTDRTTPGTTDGISIAAVASQAVSRDVPCSLSVNFGNETVTRLPRLRSNGSTAVDISPASVVTYALILSVYNLDSIGHTVTFMSSTGSAILLECYVPANGNVILDGPGTQAIRTTSGDKLQFKHDGAGAANALYLTGATVQR